MKLGDIVLYGEVGWHCVVWWGWWHYVVWWGRWHYVVRWGLVTLCCMMRLGDIVLYDEVGWHCVVWWGRVTLCCIMRLGDIILSNWPYLSGAWIMDRIRFNANKSILFITIYRLCINTDSNCSLFGIIITDINNIHGILGYNISSFGFIFHMKVNINLQTQQSCTHTLSIYLGKLSGV